MRARARITAMAHAWPSQLTLTASCRGLLSSSLGGARAGIRDPLSRVHSASSPCAALVAVAAAAPRIHHKEYQNQKINSGKRHHPRVVVSQYPTAISPAHTHTPYGQALNMKYVGGYTAHTAAPAGCGAVGANPGYSLERGRS